MCGRYTIVKSAEELEKQFEIDVNKEVYQPSFNLAPSQIAPIITNENPHLASFFKWGLVPPWANDATIGYKMINARSETLSEKPAFKMAFEKRRCVVLADGFYEWKKHGKLKIPSYIFTESESTMAFAGLWEKWTNNQDEDMFTFTIITKKANSFMQQIHERMPCILENKNQISEWLSNSNSINNLVTLLNSPIKTSLKMHEVSVLVNSPKINRPSLINPVENFGTLF